MPIGFGNLRVIEGNEEVQATAFTANVTYMGSVNIQNNEYVLGFQDDGSAQFVNLTTNTKGNIAAAGTFSNADVMITQWKNERALIIDPNNGYKTWDGTDLHDIGSVNSIEITNSGLDIRLPILPCPLVLPISPMEYRPLVSVVVGSKCGI
jgi:hypothetical protein